MVGQPQSQLHLGMGRPERARQRRHHTAPKPKGGGDAQRPAQSAGHLGDARFRALDRLHHIETALVEQLAPFGGVHASRRPHQQLAAKIRL